jgi:hypothetical protein
VCRANAKGRERFQDVARRAIELRQGAWVIEKSK